MMLFRVASMSVAVSAGILSSVMCAQVDSETPQVIADQLLLADRAFSRKAREANLVDGLTAMFRDDVTVAGPGGFATNLDEARAALLSNADNLTSRTEWTPLRAGISADGAHGFTFGLMSVHPAGIDANPDGARPGKYLAYWIKDQTGWRVAVYKRGPAGNGSVQQTMAPALPRVILPVSADHARLEAARESLRLAEQAFSDEAQRIGIGPAFVKYGSGDAVNMGGPDQPGFVVGAEAIGALVGAGTGGGSPYSWSADRVIVASSGDLGVTIGNIRRNDPADRRPPIPFFTVWRRALASEPWRYIAE